MTGLMRQLRIDFGRRWITPQELASLEAGHVVALEARVDDLVDVYVNGHLFACGEAVVANGKLGVRVTHLVQAPGTRDQHQGLGTRVQESGTRD